MQNEVLDWIQLDLTTAQRRAKNEGISELFD